jgi:hypothetical protein
VNLKRSFPETSACVGREQRCHNTFMANPSYALWSIWTELPTTARLFVPILAVVAIYSLFSATAILVRLRSIVNPSQSKDVAALQRSVAVLHARSTNVRHLILATFYLFGIVFFFGLWSVRWTPDSSRASILDGFFAYFAFAVNAFFIFLVLHSVQWFVSGRLQACALRLNASHIE